MLVLVPEAIRKVWVRGSLAEVDFSVRECRRWKCNSTNTSE